jgi:RNA polymerase sigma-70 factor, ECF subfamily
MNATLIDNLAREHLPMLIRLAYRILGSASEAEETVQDAFLEVVQKRLDKINNPAGFLRHVVTCRSLDLLRKRRPLLPLTIDAQDASHEPEQMAMAVETSNRLRLAIANLSPRTAEIFTMRYLAELGNTQIAATLGISENAVAVSLRRARTELQTVLKRDEL